MIFSSPILQPFLKEESSPCESKPEPSSAEDPPKESINFLENARVTDPCKATHPDMKMPFSDNDTIMASPTVGSLNFFLGTKFFYLKCIQISLFVFSLNILSLFSMLIYLCIISNKTIVY